MYKKLIVIMMIFVGSMYGSENEFKARIDRFENLFKRYYCPQADFKREAEFFNFCLDSFFNSPDKDIKGMYEMSTMYIGFFIYNLQREDSQEARILLTEFLSDIVHIKDETGAVDDSYYEFSKNPQRFDFAALFKEVEGLDDQQAEIRASMLYSDMEKLFLRHRKKA